MTKSKSKTTGQKSQQAEICLVMIVKNESRIIRRCLDQLVGLVDYVCISDTGSTDNTVEIIEGFIKEEKAKSNIKGGAVFHHTWKNFGHNRTLSSRAAQRWLLKEKGVEDTTSEIKLEDLQKEDVVDEDDDEDGPEGFTTLPKTSTSGTTNLKLPHPGEDPDPKNLIHLKNVGLLMLDADMRLWVHPRYPDKEFRHFDQEKKEEELRRCQKDREWIKKWKETVIVDKLGMVNQWGPNIIYPNIRFTRADQWVSCHGPTHEYYAASDPVTMEDVKQRSLHRECSIEDIGDGGSKTDKFERDIRLLKDGIQEEPSNARYWFYLGNSYKNHGDYKEAIETYKERIRLGGWEEEIFMSYLYTGECNEVLGNHAEALMAYLKAYNSYPVRSETLHRASVLARKLGLYRVSEMVTEKGRQIRMPEGGGLFIEPNVYDFMFTEETSIYGFYNGKKDEGREACLKIVKNDKVHQVHRQLAEKNLEFYK